MFRLPYAPILIFAFIAAFGVAVVAHVRAVANFEQGIRDELVSRFELSALQAEYDALQRKLAITQSANTQLTQQADIAERDLAALEEELKNDVQVIDQGSACVVTSNVLDLLR
jgi:hypothetical protein